MDGEIQLIIMKQEYDHVQYDIMYQQMQNGDEYYQHDDGEQIEQIYQKHLK
jgi:hypothetical protein